MCVSYTFVGDINKDGTVNILDTTLLQKYLADKQTFTGGQLCVSAVNCDLNEISILCATEIQKYSADYDVSLETKSFTSIKIRNLIINPIHDLFDNITSVKR